jgi:hypothetical protein
MKNAHERFGVLEYTKRMKDTTTRIRVRLDRFIGEVENDRNYKTHLVSVLGGDADVGASRARVTYEIKSGDMTLTCQQVPTPTPLQARAYKLISAFPVTGN